jgi:hypothetical protein
MARSPSPSVSKRGQVAALARWRNSDDPELAAAKQALATQVLAEHIAETLARTPLTPVQLEKLVTILLGGV